MGLRAIFVSTRYGHDIGTTTVPSPNPKPTHSNRNPYIGIYVMRFFIDGAWVLVMVDSLLPCIEKSKGQYVPLYARHDGASTEPEPLTHVPNP